MDIWVRILVYDLRLLSRMALNQTSGRDFRMTIPRLASDKRWQHDAKYC